MTFAALLVTQKREKGKVSLCFFAGERCSPPVSATPTHMLRICVNPRHALSAGVRTMRARICSIPSCDMFARVVWLRLRRVEKPQIFAMLPCRTYSPRTISCD